MIAFSKWECKYKSNEIKHISIYDLHDITNAFGHLEIYFSILKMISTIHRKWSLHQYQADLYNIGLTWRLRLNQGMQYCPFLAFGCFLTYNICNIMKYIVSWKMWDLYTNWDLEMFELYLYTFTVFKFHFVWCDSFKHTGKTKDKHIMYNMLSYYWNIKNVRAPSVADPNWKMFGVSKF